VTHQTPTAPGLCGATYRVGENVHRCYDDAGHPYAHACICWFRWDTTTGDHL